MKNINQIYADIIEPISMQNSFKKPTKRDLSLFNMRLISLIVGMVLGSDLNGDKIDRLAKKISKLTFNSKQ